MEQYISKAALVAEIERREKYAQTLSDNAINSSMQQFYDGMKQGCVDILSFLDTFEVKEVDLDRISRHYALNNTPWDDCADEMQEAYKAGFGLGIKAQKGE